MKLIEERRVQYAIIDNVLERLGHTPKGEPKNTSMEPFVRFDPTDVHHDQFVVKHEGNKESDCKQTNTTTDTKPLPEVSSETFFEVNTDFNQTISSLNHTSSGFKFSFDIDEGDKAVTGVEQVLQTTTIDSSDDEKFECFEDSTHKDSSKIQREPFFISLNPKFKSNECHNMICEKSEEAIREDWIKVRNKLTNDYKKRHRDALRFQKKLSSKES